MWSALPFLLRWTVSLCKLWAKVDSSSFKLPLVRYWVTTRNVSALPPEPHLTRVPIGFSRVQCITPTHPQPSVEVWYLENIQSQLLLPYLAIYMDREHGKDGGRGGFQNWEWLVCKALVAWVFAAGPGHLSPPITLGTQRRQEDACPSKQLPHVIFFLGGILSCSIHS